MDYFDYIFNYDLDVSCILYKISRMILNELSYSGALQKNKSYQSSKEIYKNLEANLSI